ncbi:DDE-type integrase/transposase/recombinase [Ralstonia pickettii]|uniref:DDE-type integrase/transposase/recombinase n=1 Tax=Ralstonia pickettii TaxID=329 RepID=UPI002E81DF77|nr:DDE-type integrase/transposase/recombinase [Ralstonia pickettii]
MDFKGGFALADGQRCSPLTVIDDHSRFNLVLAACTQTQSAVVQRHLRQAFERYGLPLRINADNGAPWGSPTRPGQLTGLGVWLIRLGVRLSYSRPPPADQRQGRALPPHAQGRGPGRALLRLLRRGPARAGCLAHRL